MFEDRKIDNSCDEESMSETVTTLKGDIKQNEAMSRHTSWRAGGIARQFFVPEDVDDLCHFLQQLDSNESLLWLGLGSNLLIRDGGFDGTVISTVKLPGDIRVNEEFSLYTGAGVACPKVARYSAQQGMMGAEFFAGIPGTIGGALAMNAGAFGGETWNIVNSVETINRNGEIHQRSIDDFEISYRSVKQKNEEWFLSANLQLSEDKDGLALQTIKILLAKRSESQPMGLSSCGSVFRNPPEDHAARLIEASGLKGETIGGACISTKHANFIINLGNATASDIENLIEKARQIVKEKFDVELITEVRVIGDL